VECDVVAVDQAAAEAARHDPRGIASRAREQQPQWSRAACAMDIATPALAGTHYRGCHIEHGRTVRSPGMPVHLREVVGYLDSTLEIERFKDYAPNGLPVEGAPEVEGIVTGVSASVELISRAVELGADLIVVHHGLVWGPGLTKIAGPLARRLKLLLGNDVSLAAYHLPLDKHVRLGNNVGL